MLEGEGENSVTIELLVHRKQLNGIVHMILMMVASHNGCPR